MEVKVLRRNTLLSLLPLKFFIYLFCWLKTTDLWHDCIRSCHDFFIHTQNCELWYSTPPTFLSPTFHLSTYNRLLFNWNLVVCGSAGEESTCNVGDLGLIPGLGRPPGEGKGYPLLYAGLENSMDYIVHGVTKNWTRLNDFHFHLFYNIVILL